MSTAVSLRLSEVVDRLYAALFAGDPGSVRELLTDDVEWHVPGAVHRGRAAVLGYFVARREGRLAPLEVLSGEDHIAVIVLGTVTKDGLERSWSEVALFRLQDGLVSECRVLPLDQAAYDAIWS